MSYPYLGPAAHTSAGDNLPPTRIVLHGTVSNTIRGGARDIARYFRSEAAGGSAQYVVDPGEIVQVAHDKVIAWGAPPNPHSLHLEFCDQEGGRPDRWFDPDHTSMLLLGAGLVAAKCARYKLPIVRLHPADLLAGKHGITDHLSVSQAWHQSTHTDPIDFPWAHFMHMVTAAAHPAPTPAPHRVILDGGDMFNPYLINVKGSGTIYVVTLGGTRHVKNATELDALIKGGVPATPRTVTAKQLADLLEVE